MPDGLTKIESEAFVDLPEIDGVRIPSKVTDIADDAFDSTIIIFTSAGSYAATWASEHGFDI